MFAASPNSSYNAVPLLVLLTKSTGDRRYLDAAIRAADFCWSNGQSQGRFVGGTIDNPDVLDKEAATLSLEAYLHLYDATRDPKWLPRAVAAANFAETWIYCWNVPMPEDDDDAGRHWKRGVPTAGLQLISTGHSLVDAYMAFDVDEFAQLARLTDDTHYLDVAQLLLHNTKNMLALPGRTFDLGEPGWQQEHWSLAPRRGYGLHRGWLPWVATSQLNGIFGLLDLDPDLDPAPTQYILFNRAPGQGMNQHVPETLGRKQFEEVLAQFPNRPEARVQTGLSYVFSCFRTPPETTLAALKTFLAAAEETDTPVLVQIDTEHWWEARPDFGIGGIRPGPATIRPIARTWNGPAGRPTTPSRLRGAIGAGNSVSCRHPIWPARVTSPHVERRSGD